MESEAEHDDRSYGRLQDQGYHGEETHAHGETGASVDAFGDFMDMDATPRAVESERAGAKDSIAGFTLPYRQRDHTYGTHGIDVEANETLPYAIPESQQEHNYALSGTKSGAHSSMGYGYYKQAPWSQSAQALDGRGLPHDDHTGNYETAMSNSDHQSNADFMNSGQGNWSTNQAYGSSLQQMRGSQMSNENNRQSSRQSRHRQGGGSRNTNSSSSNAGPNSRYYTSPAHNLHANLYQPGHSNNQVWNMNATNQPQANYYGLNNDLDTLAEELQNRPPYQRMGSSDYAPAVGLSVNFQNYVGQGPSSWRRPQNREYCVLHSSYFAPGNVLLIDWPEPKGRPLGTTVVSGGGPGSVYRKDRRFIIMTTFEGHSQCLPIITYGNRGCCKKGARCQYHGIVYSSGNQPKLLNGEDQLGFEPVMMIPNNETEHLRPESRINYTKTYPVEHNCPVVFIGHIHEPHLDMMYDALRSLIQGPLKRRG